VSNPVAMAMAIARPRASLRMVWVTGPGDAPGPVWFPRA
jgi:hypothetical protein